MKTHHYLKKNLWGSAFLSLGVITPLYGGTSEQFPIATTVQSEGCMSAAFDGTNFLAGILGNTLDSNGISWQRISQTGALLGERINQGSFGSGPVVGFGAGTYLVAWDSAGDTNTQIYGQRVNTNGTAIGSAVQISFSTGDVEISDYSKVAFGDGKFLMVWEDYRSGDEPDIYGQLIRTNGTLFGSEIPIATDNVDSGEQGDNDDKEASVAFDGTNFLVAFTAERREGFFSREDVYGQFVSPSGTLVGDNFVIDENNIPSCNPTATCWDGEKYTVLFHEGIEGEATEFEEQWDIIARFVSPNGIVATNRIAIATSPTDSEQFPSIAYDGTHYLITVSCSMGISTNTPTGTNTLSRARLFDSQLNPTTPWFTIYDPVPFGIFPFSGAVAGNNNFAVGISLMSGDFDFIDVYGVMVDSAPPKIESFDIQETTASLFFTNLFLGTTNRIEQNASLTTNNWVQAGEFLCTSPSTNWTGSISNEWTSMFYRLQIK